VPGERGHSGDADLARDRRLSGAPREELGGPFAFVARIVDHGAIVRGPCRSSIVRPIALDGGSGGGDARPVDPDMPREEVPVLTGGNATIFVSDMDKAVDFYTRVLGMKLRMRAENFWAEVQAGATLVIGLHPASPSAEPPGTPGAIQIGLTVSIPLEEVGKRLASHGVQFQGSIIDDGPGRFASIRDPDGNKIYFWETRAAVATGEGCG
jgi:catechol 2,3-dioxygenase-like lactoylglutathione lyase family enzyme